MFSDEEVNQMADDIVNLDSENPEEKAVENQPEGQEPQNTEPETQPMAFKTMDDLLKFKMKYETALGKEVEEDLGTVLKRAGYGYNYAQLKNEINQQKQQYETEYKPQIDEAQKLREKYAKLEEYAQSNPDWYDHWSNAWENRETQQGENPNADMQSLIKEALTQELAPIREFMTARQQQEQHAQVEKEFDQQFQTVEQTRKQFPQFDFTQTDPETGKDIELEVLEYMQKSGIKDFNAAFKALKHDEIVKMQVEQQRLANEKADQERKKNGVMGVRPATTRKATPNLRGLSPDQVLQLIEKDTDIFPNS